MCTLPCGDTYGSAGDAGMRDALASSGVLFFNVGARIPD